MHSTAGTQSLIVLSAPEKSPLLFRGLCRCRIIHFPTFRIPNQDEDFPAETQNTTVGSCCKVAINFCSFYVILLSNSGTLDNCSAPEEKSLWLHPEQAARTWRQLQMKTKPGDDCTRFQVNSIKYRRIFLFLHHIQLTLQLFCIISLILINIYFVTWTQLNSNHWYCGIISVSLYASVLAKLLGSR